MLSQDRSARFVLRRSLVAAWPRSHGSPSPIQSQKKGKWRSANEKQPKGQKRKKERMPNSNSSPSRAKIALALRVTSSVKARWFQEQVQSYSHGAADYGTWRRSPSGIRHGRRLLSRVEKNGDRPLALRGRFPEVYMEACHPD